MFDVYADDPTTCELCGETYGPHDERGEFWDEVNKKSVLAHASCGLEHELSLA